MNNDLNIGISHYDLENIIRLIKKCPKVEGIILFGSRAKGTFSNGSDVDIALKGENIQLTDVLDLSIDLDELELPYKFDIIIFDRIKEKALTDHINSVGIVLT